MAGLLLAIIYVSFISLGLPDAVLGSAWPIISTELETTVSSMGIITIIISAGTIISGLQSDRLIKKIGVHTITFVSVALTAVSLFGFSMSPSFFVLCLWAVPYGLGAGSVDAALNNYVAVNFESKHMSWLHCMWGLGATLGPYIMGMALTNNLNFRGGYMILCIIQAVLTVIILASKPVWKMQKTSSNNCNQEQPKALSLKQIFKIRGVPEIAVTFLCFCAIEQTAGLWASSYLVYTRGVEPEIAAGFTALFYLGITIGRGINGFIAIKCSDTQMIRGGSVIMLAGILILFLPFGKTLAFVGLAMIGFGSAPVYPCIIHSTPYNFGAENSQAIIGVQMALAYTGTLTMPALFGIIGKNISFTLYPLFIGFLLAVMIIMYEKLLKKVKTVSSKRNQGEIS
ncbi:MAG: MFS transporter [Spirochaetales bacterium]